MGGVEVVVQNGVSTARRYVAGVALQTVVDGAVQATRYLFHDHLGSLVRIANVDGSVAESLDYTAFGDRRAYGNPGGTGSASVYTPRGFTGHEMVDGAQVIHMNGRIYDPQLGRFLQPDPVIQEPTNAQSWNAYTYVFNNPLAYTDPTGMMSERAWNNVWRVAGLAISIITAGAASPYLAAGTAAGTATGMAIAAAGGFFAGYAATGTLKSAVIGAFSAAITAGIAGSGMSGYEQMAAQAVTGGVVESLQGGSFGHGFVAAGLTTYFMPQVGGYSAPVRTALGALIGGTISAVTGGKFANGAISGAVQGAMAKESSPKANAVKDGYQDENPVGDFAKSPEERQAFLREMVQRGKLGNPDAYHYVDDPKKINPNSYADTLGNGKIFVYPSAFETFSYYNFGSVLYHEYVHALRFSIYRKESYGFSKNTQPHYMMEAESYAKMLTSANPFYNGTTSGFRILMIGNNYSAGFGALTDRNKAFAQNMDFECHINKC